MLNASNQRMLAYIEKVTAITPIEKADRLEAVHINGWVCVCGKGEFKEGDVGVFFEIDSKLPEIYPFTEMEFLVNKKYKIKSQKIRGQISQGLFMPLSAFENGNDTPTWVDSINFRIKNGSDVLHEDLTAVIGVTYAVEEDNKRKAPSVDKYKKMSQRHPQVFRQPWARWMMKREWGRKVMFFFFGKKKDTSNSGWPVGKFPGVSKTDQERVENMVWILEDKTPFIVTQKCDGSSGTFILERKKKNKFEFYVCSRNVRMMKPDQKCFYDDNYYWEVAVKYDIENKMKDYLVNHPELTFVCWQGEICAPSIQKNPHKLSETHLFCFHMTDNTGRYDIREAKKIWDSYDMETVPIVNDNYIMPDDFEAFKLEAEGFYEPSVCEGQTNCAREGFVYYKTTEPSFSFKNVSRQYLLNHGQ
ncbi:MAG: hypothetical protein LIO71_03550 [Ruminococcus sp.]|nr:hypothetical protein [Ruminococcus sp.]